MAPAVPIILWCCSVAAAATPRAALAAASCLGKGEGALRAVELERPDAALLVFGARHRTEPSDPIMAELERRVIAFSPTLVLVEGPVEPVEQDRETAIAHGGEEGLLCHLAARRGIPCQSLDLPEAEEARRLLQRHAPDEVLLFLSVRVLAYFNPRPASQRPPGELVAWTLRRCGPLAGLPDATEEDLARAFERRLHRRWEPGAVTTACHDPARRALLTQRMSRESNALREPYMLDQLLAGARRGARVFASLGEGHLCDFQAELSRRWKDGSPDAGDRRSPPALTGGALLVGLRVGA